MEIDQRLALRELYARFRQPIDELTAAIVRIEPEVEAVRKIGPQSGALHDAIEQFASEYGSMKSLGDDLTKAEAQMSNGESSAQLGTESLKTDILERRVSPEAYLENVLKWERMTRVDRTAGLRDTVAETEWLESLMKGFPDRLLAWLDLAAQIRESATSEAPSLAEACTRLIAAARPIVLRQWQIEIDDVPVGTTRFDYRLHDMVISKPSPDVAPETVIAVHRLGHRRQGQLMRKPQVIVAATVGGE